MAWADLIYKFRIPIFYAAAMAALTFLIAGLLIDVPYTGVIAFGFIGLLIVLFDFRILFYLLLSTLPFSNEIQITTGLSMYMPTEPLTIILLGLTVVYAALNPKLLKGRFWKHPITIVVYMHLLWIVFTAITSSFPLVSTKYIAAKLWFVVTYYFLASYLIRDQFAYRRVFWLIFIPTIAGIIYVLTRHAITGFVFDEVSNVVRPIYRNHVNYGVWITAILPLMVLARSWYKKDTLMRLSMNVAIILTLAAIYFSYTRGAWVALFCLPIFLLIVKWRLSKVAVITSLVGGLILVGVLFSNNRYLEYAPDFNKTIYHEDFSDHMTATFQMEDMSTVERFYRWIAAIKMFNERPVTGFGPGNFVNNYKTYTVTAYQTYISDNEEGSSVHNYFLTMLTEQGLPGLIIFIFLVVITVLYFERVYHKMPDAKERNFILALASCFLVLLINNFFSDLLEADKLGPLFFMCMAILVQWDLRYPDADTKQMVEEKMELKELAG